MLLNLFSTARLLQEMGPPPTPPPPLTLANPPSTSSPTQARRRSTRLSSLSTNSGRSTSPHHPPSPIRKSQKLRRRRPQWKAKARADYFSASDRTFELHSRLLEDDITTRTAAVDKIHAMRQVLSARQYLISWSSEVMTTIERDAWTTHHPEYRIKRETTYIPWTTIYDDPDEDKQDLSWRLDLLSQDPEYVRVWWHPTWEPEEELSNDPGFFDLRANFLNQNPYIARQSSKIPTLSSSEQIGKALPPPEVSLFINLDAVDPDRDVIPPPNRDCPFAAPAPSHLDSSRIGIYESNGKWCGYITPSTLDTLADMYRPTHSVSSPSQPTTMMREIAAVVSRYAPHHRDTRALVSQSLAGLSPSKPSSKPTSFSTDPELITLIARTFEIPTRALCQPY